MRQRYTSFPRPVLWLVPEGELLVGESTVAVEPFYLSTLPVTNRELEAFTGPRQRSPCAAEDDNPAIGVSFDLASAYCGWYAGIARKAIRLPTELEWEHACRAGAVGLANHWWGDDETGAEAYVWHRGNSGSAERVPPLAAKRSNPFGLYAMLGGVWEWATSETGPVLRGGSWRTPLRELDCTLRRTREQAAAAGELAEAGFRIAKSLRG
ncbi:MAG TPA: SUMF1/EgtB/PvdO family nonheme iron enzyme [Thermoanaerobaculia bacterium]|nr:SUMF1/EgtB/PvdO family nonheme iron enzyme [Thermoanaerobaculia bacterium]